MSTVSVPRPPSAAELERALRDKIPGLTVYNPSSTWLRLQVYGIFYWIPPDMGGAVENHPVTGKPTVCDGRLSLRGRYLTQKDSSGKVIEGQDAGSMVKYVVSVGPYGEFGVCWLPGDSEQQDKVLVENARRIYSRYQESRDEMIVARRVEFKANWEKGPRRHEACPPPTPQETAAMDRLQKRQREASYKYECDVPNCPTGYAANEWDRFVSHMKAAHNVTPDRGRYEGGLTAGGVAGVEEVPASDPQTAIAQAAEAMREAMNEDETPADTPVPKPRLAPKRK